MPIETMVFVTPCIPDRYGVGWEQRAFSFLSAYAKLYAVTLWFQPTNDNGELKRLQPALDLVEAAYSFDQRFLPHDPRSVNQLIRTLKAATLVHVFRLERFLQHLEHPAIIWDIDEIPYELRDESRNTGLVASPPGFVASLHQCFETCWKKARVVISSSTEERHPVFGVPKVVPNVTRIGSKRAVGKGDREILFVGNLNKKENLDGVDFFVDSCMPFLPDDVRFTVVGRRPVNPKILNKLQALTKNPKVKIFYDVADCDPFYQRARLVIVPLQQGAGTKLKLLEAFGQHCPVVTTTKGIEGLDVVDGRDALVRDSAEGFAQACKALLYDEKLAIALADSGHQLVSTAYSQDRVDSILQQITASLLVPRK